METDGVISEIGTDILNDCIGGTLQEVIKKNEQAKEVTQKKREDSLK